MTSDLVEETFNINKFNNSMEKHKTTNSLNFIKCIINKTDISSYVFLIKYAFYEV